MIKEILHPQIHYYRNAIRNPQQIIEDLESLESTDSPFPQISSWKEWRPSQEDIKYGYLKGCYFNLFQNKTLGDRLNAKICGEIAYNAIALGEEYSKDSGVELGYLPEYFAINKYDTNVRMGPHVDANHGAQDQSTVSMVIYLNDDYEGGEIDFPDHGISIKPEAGSIVVFSSEGVLHDPKPTLSGTKYMVPLFFFKR
jgi:hypothetical protein